LSIGLKEVAMSLARRGINLMQINRSVLHGSYANIGDYVALTKPRVMSLVVFTALVGLMVAPSGVDPFTGVVALLCIAAGAGAAGALNMWYDADIDAVMARTAMRPIPSGRVSRPEALVFGLMLGTCAILVLGTLLNMAAAALLLVPISLIPCALGFAGAIYGAAAAMLGAIMIFLAWQVRWSNDKERRPARRLFVFSMLYLVLLFGVPLMNAAPYAQSQ
jgi:heme O synthase-like polyprenyltransferase